MSIWISQASVEKEKIYRKTKDERVLWLSPLGLVRYLAGSSKTNLDTDRILDSFKTKGCLLEELVKLFRLFKTWGDKFDSEIALKIIADPDKKEILENVRFIRDSYYNRKTRSLYEIPKLKPALRQFSDKMRKYYRSFKIPKKNGTKRIINAPCPELWYVQKMILKHILYPNYPFTKSNPANGFIPEKSILTNAAVHENACIIVNLDLKDAFTNTTEEKLMPALEEYFTKAGAGILVKLCCMSGYLPQGAPTSPMLLNYALLKMDGKLSSFAKGCGWRYSRYADDLSFSCETKDSSTLGTGSLIKKLTEIVANECGYKINNQKIRVFKPKRAMKVTGLVLNSGKPTISRKTRRLVRAKVHNFVTKGIGNLKEIEGYISYIALIHKGYANKLRKQLKSKIETSKSVAIPSNQ